MKENDWLNSHTFSLQILFLFAFVNMENDDFAAPIYILMIAAACHIICNNQRGWRTWVRPWIQLRREVGAYHALMRHMLTAMEDSYGENRSCK
jgi:hypothetical protein